MEKSLTPRRFSQVGWGEGGSWVGHFCVNRSTAKIWFFRRLAAVTCGILKNQTYSSDEIICGTQEIDAHHSRPFRPGS